jgi:hypothetical protein
LKWIGTLDQQIEFLETAVQGLGVVDGQLVHRLSRALIWRGDRADLERIRQLQHLARMLEPDDLFERCELRQTDIWARFMIAKDAELAHGAIPLAPRRGVQRAVRNYIATGCLVRRLGQGQWKAMSEIVGVAIAAEASNGHDGLSNMIRRVAESYPIPRVSEFCRAAVPAGVELRDDCEKRVGDELFLAR